jgi:hypothetical protein
MAGSRQVPAVVWKVLITLGLGGASYLITNVTEQAEIWQITISVFIGGAALIVQYLADLEQQSAQHAKRVDELVEDGFRELGEVSSQLRDLKKSPVTSDEVKKILRNAAQLKHDGPPLLYAFVRAQLRSTATLVGELRSGKASYKGEDREWLLTLASHAFRSIDAASTSVDQDFWNADLGIRYLRAQQEAVRRGVKVRRLFFLKRPGPNASQPKMRAYARDRDRINALRQRQTNLGIEVRVLELPEEPDNEELVNNFVVFDEVISYEMQPEELNPSRIARTNLGLFTSAAECMAKFDDWWERGQ